MSIEKVRHSLEKVACDLQELGPGRWRFGLDGNGKQSITARLDEEWLLLATVPANGAGRAKPWTLLERSAGLAGFAKFALRPENGTLELRAEIPLDGQVRTAERLARSCAGLCEEARQSVKGEVSEPIDLPALCDEAGWGYFERDDNEGAVTLEAGDGFHQARVRPDGPGLHAWVPVTAPEAKTETRQSALAVLLLTAAAVTRLARPVVIGSPGLHEAGFEVRFEDRPSAGELSQALSALSVACRLCAREARALSEPSIAEQYLALRGPGRYRTTRRRRRTGARKGG